MLMAKRTLIAAVVLPVWLAACAAPLPPTALTVPSRFTQAESSDRLPAAPARWWTVFEDPQLDALVRATLDHNRDLRMAVQRFERARALGRAEASALLPTGGGTVAAERARVPAVTTGTGQPRTEERVGAQVALAWEIDLFGRLRAAARAADFESAASAADVAALRSMLVAELSSAYFAWQGAQAQLSALAEIVAGQRKQLDLARTRLELGATDELDVRRAHSELLDSQAQQAGLQAEIVQLASRIAVLSGRFAGDLVLEARTDAGTAAARPVMVGTPQWVLTRRPDVGAADARLRAAIARSEAAWADMLPRLALGGSFGVLAGSASDLGADAARGWALQPSLAIPLLDLLQLAPLKEARDAEARIALAAWEGAVLAAIADVEASAGAHRSSVERVRLLAGRRDDAERALQIAEARYEAGSIDQLAVLDAQRSRRAAAIELAAAIAEHRIAVVRLYRAIGATA
jgi:NodT family efflux transporter outer membrane factor (OMF) lipoprotein